MAENKEEKKRIIARKVAWKVVKSTLIALGGLAVLLIFLAQLPVVQRGIARSLLKDASSQLDCEITVGRVHVFPLRTVIVKDLLVIDKHPHAGCSDTIAYVKHLTAVLSLRGLNPKGLKNSDDPSPGKAYLNFNRVSVKGGEFNLVIEEGYSVPQNPGQVEGRVCNVQRVMNITNPADMPVKRSETGSPFYIKKLQVQDFRYTMVNYRKKPRPDRNAVDYRDLDVRNIKVDAVNVNLCNRIVRGDVNHVSFTEVKSGYVAQNVSGKVRVGRGLTHVEDLNIVDEWSDAHIASYKMIYDSKKSFRHFVDEVTLDGEFNNTHVNMRTISALSGGFCNRDIPLVLNGTAHGTLNDIHWDLDVVSEDLGAAHLKGGVKGVTDFKTAAFDTEIHARGLKTNKLAKFFNEPRIAKFAPDMVFAPYVQLRGSVDSAAVKFSLSDYGTLDVDAIVHNLLSPERSVNASVIADRFPLGHVLSTDKLGALTATSRFGLDFVPQDARHFALTLHKLQVADIEAFGYNYRDISAKGTYVNDALDLQLRVNDPNLQLEYQGTLAKSRFNIPDYDFYLNITKANLTELNLYKRTEPLEVSANILAQRTYVDDDTYNGAVHISNVNLKNPLRRYNIRGINLDAFHTVGAESFEISSSFFEASYNGERDVFAFWDYLKAKLAYRHFPSLQKEHTSKKPQLYHLDAKFTAYPEVLSYFVEGLYIEKGTELYVNTTSDDNVRIGMGTGRLAVKKTNAKDVALEFVSTPRNLAATVNSSALNVMDFDFENAKVKLDGATDSLRFYVGYRNQDTLYNANIALDARFLRNAANNLKVKVYTHKSNVSTHNNNWIATPTFLEFDNNSLKINNFSLYSRAQSLEINGSTADTLAIKFKDIELGSFKDLLPEINLQGKLNGDVRASLSHKALSGNVKIDSTSVNSVQLGSVGINVGYKGEDKRLGGTIYSKMPDGSQPVTLKVNMDLINSLVNAQAAVDKFDLRAVEPFVSGFVSNLGGEVTGNIGASINDGKLVFTKNAVQRANELLLDNVGFKVGFTGVQYVLDGKILATGDSRLVFDNIDVKDTKGGRGTLGGFADCRDIRSLAIDAKLQMDGIEAVDLKGSSAGFSGNIFTSGTVGLRGPVSSLLLWSDASVAKKSTLVIPLWRNSKNQASKILSFLSSEDLFHNDDYLQMLELYKTPAKKRSNSVLQTRLGIAASENLQTKIELGEFDETAINAIGRGNIVLSTNSQTGEFAVKGDYLITEGLFHFNAVSLVTRDFILENGSTIKFNGPIMKSALDVSAIYKTKANIATLIADTTSTATRKSVDCIVKIGGTLVSPVIDFDIKVPDLDPMARSKVESALMTKDKIQRQFFSLLISNSFMPNEESGIINNSTVVYSNVSEIMANQVSRILHKLDIPVDLGLNYQPQKNGKDVFDVAISTQLFNNRVEIGGSISNGNRVSSGISGDVDVEVKINKPGTLRVKAFSHSPNEYNYFSDNSQRNGVGISFQKEFSNFKELFTPLHSREAKTKKTKNTQKKVKRIKSKHKNHGRK